MATRWLRITVDNGSTHDLELNMGRTTIGGSSPHMEAIGEPLDIDLEELLPPGPQAALLVTEERVLVQALGRVSVENEDGRLAAKSGNLEVLPGQSVYLGEVEITAFDAKPEATVSRAVLFCVVMLCASLAFGLAMLKNNQEASVSPSRELVLLLEEHPELPAEHAALVRRGLLAEESGECALATSYYRRAWRAVDPQSPLRFMAEQGKARCEAMLRAQQPDEDDSSPRNS